MSESERWAQMKVHLNVAGADPIRDEDLLTWFHDPDVQFPNPSTVTNLEPLLINTVNSLQYRPNADSEIPNLLLASDSVRAMLQTDDGTLWVLTAGGLSSATIGHGDSAKLRFETLTVRDGMLSEQVNAIARAGDGGVWAGTPQGLNHIRGTGVERGPPGTFGRSIDAMSEDDSGTLLFATSEGVMQLRDGAVRVLANREALPVGGVRTLLATPNGVWAAGRSSVILIQPHAIVTFATGRALPGTQIEAMLVFTRAN